MIEINGYDLSRSWFNFCFENPDKVKPNHTAIFFFAIEHCNRLGWKIKFGFPTTMVMEATGIKSYNTYIKCFNEIVGFGFFRLIEKSKNQYSSNIIALSKNDKAHNEALDKALINHNTKQIVKQQESTVQSNDSINKQLTTNKEQRTTNKEQLTIKNTEKEFSQEVENCLSECLKYFDDHLHPETKARESWLDTIEKLNRIDNIPFETIIQIVAWARNDDFWSGVFLSIPKLRTKDKNGLKYIISFNEKMKKNGTNKGNSSQTGGATDEYRLKVARKLGLTEQG